MPVPTITTSLRASEPFWSTLDHTQLRLRAEASLSSTPRPFLRWAGSKRKLLPQLIELLPDRYLTYYEPFVGAGSLFFLLQPSDAVLGDACDELVATWQAIRDNPAAVLRYLQPLVPDRDTFYDVRQHRSSGRYKRAAEFIYLNKTCWNGLYRVNSRGEFNVPYGAPRSNHVIDADNLRACSGLLSAGSKVLRRADFSDTLDNTIAGDLVFLDPPYVTRHNNNGFIDYNETLFSWNDQERLAREAKRLADRGVHVIVTNAFHNDVIDLYDGFFQATLGRHSTLASATTSRGRVSEVALWYPGDIK